MSAYETEVFRLSPSDLKPDKYYLHALYTRKEGKWPNTKYFTKIGRAHV